MFLAFLNLYFSEYFKFRITPIVTEVTSRGVQEIGKIVKDLADRASIGKLQLHEFQ
jgi:pyruvate/2-oxoglutarate dehydrogenase complex dihydrolipoamide acyltransferase (E2) component